MSTTSSFKRNACLILVVVFVGTVFAVMPRARAARTYYVSTTGSDAHGGTHADPFRTIGKSLSVLRAGDTLRVRGGTYVEEVRAAAVAPGREGAPITVAATPGERAVIEGSLRVERPDHWVLDGINVTGGSSSSGLRPLVEIAGGDDWVFENAEVWDAPSYHAVVISGDARRWRFAGNCVHDAGVGLDARFGNHLLVTRTAAGSMGTIERNLLFDAPTGSGVKLSAPGYFTPSSGVSVRNNTVVNTLTPVVIVRPSQHNTVDGNLLGQSGPNAAGGALIVSNSASGGNTAARNVGFSAHGGGGLLWGTISDAGGNHHPRDPGFDSTTSCQGFHPRDALARTAGRYAGLAAAGAPPPTAPTTTVPPPTTTTTRLPLVPPTAPPRPAVRSSSGDLLPLVQQFVQSRPNRYIPPEPSELAGVAQAWSEVLAGRLESASSLADPLGFDVVLFTDSGTGRELVMLSERDPRRGWGLFLHDAQATSRLVIEVAHPRDDFLTEDQGVEAFRRARARVLLIAGVDRVLADAAHEPGTVFHRVHEATVTAASTVFQPHGFADSTYPSFDIVVSRGAVPTDLTHRVTRALSDAGFSVCEFDGSACAQLGATTNVQGAQTRAVGAEFVHVEASRSVRDDPARRVLVARVVADIIA